MLKGKKVLFISPQPFFEWRGSPIRVFYNLLSLSNIGLDVDFLTLPIGKNKLIDNINIIRCRNPFFIKKIPIGPSIGKLFFDIILFFQALILMLKNRYDIIHTIEDAGLIGTILSLIFRIKHIHEKHSDTSSYKEGLLKNIVLFLYERIERVVIKYSTAVIGTGPKIVENINLIFPDKETYHIFDIPSSLKKALPEKITEIRKDLKQKDDEVLIMYVGSFAIYQGVQLMFESIPLVLKKTKKARFIIIGGSDKEIKENKKWLKQHNAENNITFLGKIEPDLLPDYLASSDILLSPRISGYNTPLKLLDYLKAGKVILATDYEANRQILNNNNCFFVKTDKNSFSEGVIKLIEDKEMRETLSENGITLIKEQYNLKKYSSMIKTCYTSVLNR